MSTEINFLLTDVPVTAALAPLVKKAEGRGQRAEGSNMVWASDPHQLQATKSEILMGDLNPCSLRSRAEGRNQNSLLPSASCPLPFLLNLLPV